jgi:hypothetical protein
VFPVPDEDIPAPDETIPDPEDIPDPDEDIPVPDEENPTPDARPKRNSNEIGRSHFHILTTLLLMSLF